MVDTKIIRETYTFLVEILKNELEINPMVSEYFNYINTNKEKFINSNEDQNTEELKQFIIEANRYSDEFSFSDNNRSEIKLLLNKLYSFLNTTNPL